MSFRPRVSVVVPVHNGAATIESCLAGLFAQDYPAGLFEILIVDNRSSDESAAVVARYPVTLLSESGILTSYAARNRGIAHAGGEIVAFTDADCIPAHDWLRLLLAALEHESVAAAVGTVEDAPPASLCEEFTARVKPFARPPHAGLKTLLTGNVAVRRAALEAVGYFDERLPTGGDVDLGWRLQKSGFTVSDAPRACVAHRHRSRMRQAFAQYRRYGLSTMLLATLHRGGEGPPRLALQFRTMLSQVRALVTYVLGFGLRCCVSVFRGFDRRYVLWPVFLFAIESGNLLGKIEGLVLTLGCTRNPFPNPRLGRDA